MTGPKKNVNVYSDAHRLATSHTTEGHRHDRHLSLGLTDL